MNVWLRTGRSAKVVGVLALGGALALVTVPMALAVEGTTTSTTDTTTETLEESEPLLEPSPTDSGLSSTDTTTDATEPVADEAGTIDDTLGTVEDTDDTGTLRTVTEPVREVIAPEEPAEEPSGQDPDDPADDGTDGDAGAPPAQDDADGEGEAAPDGVDAEPAPSTPLPAQPVAANVRRPTGPSAATADGDGPSGAHAAEASDLMAKLTAMDDAYGYGAPDGLLPPAFQLAGPRAAEVTVPLGPRSTRDILEAMGAAGDFPGTIARTLAPFPVAGPATYGDDFGAPRHVPSLHDHAGTDLFAPRGTPVIASADGTIGNVGTDTAIGGNSLKLLTADGTYFYYAHLDGFAAGIADGTTVELGQVLGFVGDTGNALGTPPHLHYEIHPGGGEAVNPVPYLDRWLANARAAAASLAGANQGVWTPQVAAPADAPQATADAAQASPTAPGGQPVAQPDPSLTSAASDTSPLSVLIVVGSVAVLFAMLRRPRATSQPTGPSSSSAASATAAPSPAPLALLPLPGEEPQVEAEEEEFQWMTIGA